MRHIAIIGSGPAGYYTAEAAHKQWGDDVQIDVFDTLPVPYGLIRTGVAPDHQSIKSVSRRYEKTALTDNVRFVGNVAVGTDISIAELQALYDAVVLATGAPNDRQLGLDGENLENVFGSASFVGWYNGHPQFAELNPDLSGRHAVVIGMGNVALDVARILAKTDAEFAGSDIVSHALDALKASGLEKVTILGRRGPHQIMMTPKELGELGNLERASPRVNRDDLPEEADDAILEPGIRKSVTHLRSFAAIPEDMHAEKAIEVEFDFFANPIAIEGDGTVASVRVEETRIANGKAVGTGKIYAIPADLVIACIGYRTSPIPGVPFDERAGRFANDGGRILAGLYCVGWARRGPSGTIGTNRPDGYSLIEKVAEDMDSGVLGRIGKKGREGFDALAKERGLDIVTFQDWKKIEEAEAAAARDGSPREKFVDIEAMIKAGH
ncbi:FAD-dependent oxidoreductase [Pontixanthobacter aestiaquae]|uniref:Pyridine nucleotide-disulfide oxidoreductase n=1 Tax=Pontixanthobacter aestiaquae TaxID=1509367 RepID=A0A844ZAA8_9SPHN|nr:FAD-dependent oxidoreductase [Pontixanthobacter aestiaquae]MDN3645200.1 FAD-dependent oxidoreductase [Pontixanthobacter aestiaquae]MXO83800.1 pyridine nucleotide-disulfide oxidoreductase [Pontixanthobacter aestiaquae]